MPRKTKEQKDLENKETSLKKKNSITTSKNKKIKEKNDVHSKAKTSTIKSTSEEPDIKSTKTVKSSTKKQDIKKETTTNSNTKSKFADIVEYYDLPYRYNQTVVKLLAQTPNTLFIYWDISNSDREDLKKQYGFDFFHKTCPILIIHNDTMNYSFEVEINDFANSWYLHVNDSNCNYHIELGRRPISEYKEVPSFQEFTSEEIIEIDKFPSKPIDRDYFYITTSNLLKSPNDHILINNMKLSDIQIKNIKTNEQYNKSMSLLENNINNIYNIHDLYKKLYKEESIEDIFDLSNPSSGNPSSINFSSQSK